MRTSSRLQSLLRRLPFDLDDTDHLNVVFRRWRQTQRPADRDLLDLWTYCYTWRYFLSKAARDQLHRPSDIDALTARAFQKACYHRSGPTRVVRYGQWVSVICRNTFVNYATRECGVEFIDAVDAERVTEPTPVYDDEPLVRRVLLAAIHRLPTYLQDTARLFFVDQCTFEMIAAALDKPVGTVRTYKARALHALRRDEELLRENASRHG